MLISLIGHLLLIPLFVFTFPSPSVTPLPLFVFLGSILENQDFTNILSQKHQTLTTLEAPISIQSPPNEYIPQKSSVNKPLFYQDIPGQPKILLKSTFAEDPIEQTQKKHLEKELGIELSVPKRTPLQLYNYNVIQK